MALKPPRGKAPAVAATNTPGSVWVLTSVVALLVLVILVVVDVAGVFNGIEPLRYGLIGLAGAGLALVPRYFSYAAGPDWFRRGDSWVDTGRLTSVAIEGTTLTLRDDKRKVRVPITVLRENDALYEALATAVRAATTTNALRLDPQTADFFAPRRDSPTGP